MRLQQYINEITEVTEEEVVDILMQGFQQFGEIVSDLESRYNPVLLVTLNKVFESLGVGFRLTKDQHMEGGTDVLTRKINLSITPQQLESLKTNKGIEAYGNNIMGILMHELIHKKQIERIPQSKRENIFKKEREKKKEVYGYFASKDEIEAYARQAAYEASNLDKWDIVTMYKSMFKNKNKKVWNRFLKKFQYYLPEE